jgi:hypothetical protein
MKISIRLIYLTISLLISFNFFSQVRKVNCDKFKNGHFKYKEQLYQNVEIIRRKNKQIEYDHKTGLKVEYTIQWTSNCQYELTQISSNNPNVEKSNGVTITVQIASIEGESYKYLANCKGVITSYTIIKTK